MSRTMKKFLCSCIAMMLVVAMLVSQVSALTYSGSSSYKSGKYYDALTKVTLTGNQRVDIVNVAKTQIGYQEGGSSSSLSGEVKGSGNYTEYGRWYGMQDMWCAMFVSWCANVAKVPTSIIPSHSYTPTGLQWFIDRGRAYSRSKVANGNYTPKSGDIIYFKSSRNQNITNHIGIVTGYSNGTVYTIEGNTSSATISTNGGAVAAKSYSITNTYIVYICKPNYQDNSTPAVTYPYKSGNDTILYDGEATTGLNTGFSTAVSLDTSTKTTGSSSLKMSCTDPAAEAAGTQIGGMVMQKLNSKANLTNYSAVAFDLYLPRTMTGSNAIQVNFGTSGYDGYNALIDISDKAAGWHTITVNLAEVGAAVADADWTNINYLRYTWFNYANSTTSTTFRIDNVVATYRYPLVSDKGLTLYDGESTYPITTHFGATASLSTEKTQGHHSLKLDAADPSATLDSGIGAMAVLPISGANLTAYDTIHFDLYLGQAMTGDQQFQVNFATEGQDGYNTVYSMNNKAAGWYGVDIKMSKQTPAVASANWANINTLRFTWFNNAQSTTPSYFLIDNVYAYDAPTVICDVHTGGTATCCEQAICDECETPYGELNANNHVGDRVVKAAIAATCIEEGYSGDTYCVSCDTMVEIGSATAIDPSNHAGLTEVKNAIEATEDEAGYSGDIYCVDCGEKIADGQVVPPTRERFKVLFDGESVDNVTTAFETEATLYGIKTKDQTSMRMSFNDPYALKNDAKIGGMAMVSLPQSVDISRFDYLCYELYLSNDMVGSGGFQVNLCTEGGDGFNTMATINNFKAGWNSVVIDLRNIAAAVPSADKTNINALRFAWFNYDGCGLSHMLIDNVRVACADSIEVPTEPYTPADLGTEFFAKINVADGINLSLSGSDVIASKQSLAPAQVWKFVQQPDGSYEILNMKRYLVFDVTGAADASNTNVGIYNDMNSVAQRWFIYETAKGYVFRPLCSGSCVLDVPTETANTSAVINGYSGADSQLFNLDIVEKYLELGSVIDLGTDIYAKIVAGNGMNLSLYDTNVIIYPDSTSAAQVWKFERQSNGSYKIINQKSGTSVLEVADGADAAGINVQLGTDNDSINQRWYVYQIDGGYALRPANSYSRVLDVYGGALLSMSNVQINNYYGETGQAFNFSIQEGYGDPLTADNMTAFRKIMYAVETGGQVYGQADYTDFTEAYTNTPEEHAITIGAGQWYGPEAKTLLNLIRSTDPTTFAALDTEGIGNDLDTANWSTYQLSKTSAKAKCIKAIISSEVGKKCQDQLMDEQLVKYLAEAESLGITDLRTKMMCANIRHLGGLSALKRVLAKTEQPYSLDTIMTAMESDTGNQVGTFTSRHKFVYNHLKQYVVY